VLVSPTVFGNVLLGPTAEDVDDPHATATTADGLARLLDHGARILPGLAGEEVTATYAGLRAATEEADYRVFVEPALRYLCLGGIRSTGLTASLALAEHALELLVGAGLDPGPRRPLARLSLPPLGEGQLRPYRDAELIAEDPAYGEIVCHCERVTRGEIRDALASRLPPADLDGLRRRTRAVLGRCGGFFCGARVRRLLEDGA
jgi:glycerol-3-phosphate dehydrogenase